MGGPSRIRRALVALTAWGAVALATLSVGGQAGGASTHEVPQLTIADAQQAFATTWPRFDTAFVNGQVGVLPHYATTTVAEVASVSTGCGCAWSTPDSRVLFSVPIEHRYPLSFLAQIETPAPRHSIFSPFVTMAVFTKARPQGRWLVAYLGRYPAKSGLLTHSIVEAPPKANFKISVINPNLATYFTDMVTNGHAPPWDQWLPGGIVGEELHIYEQTKADVEQQGDTQNTEFFATADSVAFAWPHGDVMCGTYMSISNVVPPPGEAVVQPADQLTWTDAVPPGSYATITKMGAHQVCWVVNTAYNHGNGKYYPLTFFEGVYQYTTNPAP